MISIMTYHDHTHAHPHPLIMTTSRYLSIKEAAVASGKSEITIRRLVRKVVAERNAKNRIHIQPSPKNVDTLKEKNQPFAWMLSEDLLRNTFSTDITPPAASGDQNTDDQPMSNQDYHDPTHEQDHVYGQDEFIALLRDELRSKDEQLKVKDQQISSLTTLVHSLGDQLNERLREGNVLMKGLQDRLALPAPAKEAAKRIGLFRRLRGVA